MKSLETVLDVQLLDRNNRKITSTVYGQHILDSGKTLLRDASRLESDLKLLKEGEREGRITTLLGFWLQQTSL